MSKATILLVEDNAHILLANEVALTRDGYRVLTASTLSEAYRAIENEIDLIVLDIMLPDGSGLDLCEAVRRKNADVLILFLTAMTGADHAVEGFRIGGDDYMPKPYDLRELRARIAALLKRREPHMRIEKGSIRLELLTQKAYFNDQDALLKPKEFTVLSLLMEAEGEYIPPQVLYVKGWGYDDNDDVRTVRVHIFRIRKRLEECGSTDVLIEHLRGKGYRLSFKTN